MVPQRTGLAYVFGHYAGVCHGRNALPRRCAFTRKLGKQMNIMCQRQQELRYCAFCAKGSSSGKVVLISIRLSLFVSWHLRSTWV
mmetsp:Transcript_117664/g.344594  ORF Transcript_117664/g.344594 Transcript_117664/m.344594 type:complete len:85 (-) Transcript_117664:1874-2128(-)